MIMRSGRNLRQKQLLLGLGDGLQRQPRPVAQTSCLLYRRFLTCAHRKSCRRPLGIRETCRLDVGDTADWKSALRKSIARHPVSAVVAAVAFTIGVLSACGEIVYDNTTNSLNRMVGSTNLYGDDITLAGSPSNRFVTAFKFQYYLGAAGANPQVSGTETVRLQLYDSLGPNSAPASLLFDSGLMPIRPGYNYLTVTPNVVVPDKLNWIIQFGAIPTNETAGLLVYGPPSVGSSIPNFWEQVGGIWYPRTFSSVPGSFCAQMTATAVPTNMPPTLSAHPSSQTVVEGHQAYFTVAVTGTPPLNYQWMRNGVELTGATNASLLLANVTSEQEGDYSATVTNRFGSVTSATATLTVRPAVVGAVVYDNTANAIQLTLPSTDEFGDQITLAGDPRDRFATQFRFECYLPGTTTGKETVELRFHADLGLLGGDGTLLYSSGEIPVSTGVNDVVVYPNVIVPNSFAWTVAFRGLVPGQPAALGLADPPTVGSSAPSYWENLGGTWTQRLPQGANGNFFAQLIARAVITNGPPTIAGQPQSLTVLSGTTLGLQVGVFGQSPLQYQWLFGGQPVASGTNATLSLLHVTLDNAGPYYAVVTNLLGAATSQVAVLTVLAPPTIQSQPQSVAEVIGMPLSMSVTAKGTPPLYYQWLWNNQRLAGATNALLTLGMANTNLDGTYLVTISNAVGSITSAPISLVVVPPPQERVVYDNTASYLNQMYASSNEYGDEIVLAGTPLERTVIQFVFKYFLGGTATGNQTARLKFYDNTGSNQAPRVLLYDSGPLAIALGTNNFTISPMADVSGDFTWTVQFGGLAANQPAGLLLYDPPTLGSSPTFFWEKVKGNWARQQAVGIPGNFGARVTAGPHPAPPVVLRQPQSQTVSPGATVTFDVSLRDGGTYTYQWWFNNQMIPGATQANLVLANVGASQAGLYDVDVSNALGSVTSAPGALTLVQVKMSTGLPRMASLMISGAMGSLYRIQSTDALDAASDWTTRATVTITSNPYFYLDTDSLHLPHRFYRAQPLP